MLNSQWEVDVEEKNKMSGLFPTQKYLSKSKPHAAQQSAAAFVYCVEREEEYPLTFGTLESINMPSLFSSPFSISAFASTIFPANRRMAMPTTFPSECTSFWPSINVQNISATLKTALVASLGMMFQPPKRYMGESYQAARHRKHIYVLNCIGSQGSKEMEVECSSNGRQFHGLEGNAREEDGDGEEEKGKVMLGCSQSGKESTGHKSPDDTPKLLLAGAVSTIISRTCVAPLERLKLEYVIRGAKDNWLKTIHFIWVSEGFAGFWKGNVLNLFRMVPFKSINFVTYDMYCIWLSKMPGKGEITNYDRLAAGAVSGIAATMLCLPMDTIRTRLIAPGGEALGGVVGCFQHMVRTEGLFSLYKGLMPTLLSMAPASAVFYGVYDILKAAYLRSPKVQEQLRQRIRAERETQKKLKADINTEENGDSKNQMEIGPIRTLLYGAIAGAFSETVTYPLEVVRRHLQLQETAKLGLLATFTYIVKKDGARALFAGVMPSTMQVLPSAALSYLIYEFMKVLLTTP